MKRQPPRDPANRKAARIVVPRMDTGVNRFRWTAELLQLLGRVPDRVLAKKAGLHFSTVGRERRRRGIPPSWRWQPRVDWTPEKIALLGTASDAEVARHLGVSKTTVATKRKLLRIPPYNPPLAHRASRAVRWRARDLALLGTASDYEIARRLAIGHSTVWLKRLEVGIPPWHERPEIVEWTPQRIARLGTVPDTRLAEQMSVSTATVLEKRTRLGIPACVEKRPVARTAQMARLLRRPDHQLHKETRLNLATIERLRRDLDIPPPPVVAAAVPEAPGEASGFSASQPGGTARLMPPAAGRRACHWRPEEIRLLGTAPDTEIAARLRRTVDGVARKRSQLGISPWKGAR